MSSKFNFSNLASEFGIHPTKVGQIATALQNIGIAPSDDAIRGTFKIMTDRGMLPKDAAPIYASHQKAEEVRQNPTGNNDSKFGLIQGAEELRRIAHQQTQVISDQVADDVTAAFVGDVFTKVFSGQAFTSGKKTTSVLAQIAGFNGLQADDLGELDLSKLALGGSNQVPFFSGLLLTGSKPDQTPEPVETAHPATVLETSETVEG